MRESTSLVEKVINVLILLAKEGPSTLQQLQSATHRGALRTSALLGFMEAFGLLATIDHHAIGARWWQGPWRRYKLTNVGRHYLRAFDELDPRAPFASFEDEVQA
jgi:hypothetical protein